MQSQKPSCRNANSSPGRGQLLERRALEHVVGPDRVERPRLHHHEAAVHPALEPRLLVEARHPVRLAEPRDAPRVARTHHRDRRRPAAGARGSRAAPAGRCRPRRPRRSGRRCRPEAARLARGATRPPVGVSAPVSRQRHVPLEPGREALHLPGPVTRQQQEALEALAPRRATSRARGSGGRRSPRAASAPSRRPRACASP